MGPLYVQMKQQNIQAVAATLEVCAPPRGFSRMQFSKKGSVGTNAKTDRETEGQ